MKKRAMSLALVFAMVMSMIPSVFAIEVGKDYKGEAIEKLNAAHDAAVDQVEDLVNEYSDDAYAKYDEAYQYAQYLVEEYSDDVYAEYAAAYEYARENGYIDAAIDGIDAAIEMFENVDLSEVEDKMTDELYEEIQADIDPIIATLKAAKDLIEAADLLDQESLDALLALLDEAGEAGWALLCTLEQAGVDTNEHIIVPALEEAYEYLTTVVIPQIEEQLQIAIEAGAEWLAEQIKAAGIKLVELVIAALPGIDAELYDWLYNNPDKVIAFFAEYGDEIAELVNEYGDCAVGILSYVYFSYGDEMISLIIENPCETLELLVKWYDKYGYRIWPMIDVYLEELGVYEDIGAAFEALDQMMIALGGQVEGQIEAVIEQMEAQVEILKGQLEDLKAQLEDLKNQLENVVGEIEKEILETIEKVEAAIEKIEAAIEAIEKAIEDLIEIVEDIKDTVESIMAAVEDVADVIEALKALDNSYINEILAALEETGLELMFNYMFLYDAYLDKCELGEELDYVALGSAIVIDELYAQYAAYAIDEAIGMPVSYIGITSEELTYKTQVEYIMANAEAIADAELISYQLEANEIVNALLEVVLAVNLGGDYIAPDWSEYVDVETIANVKAEVETAKAELLPYLPAQIIDTIAEAEADITAKLTEQVDAETAEQLKPYVEQLVYSLVSYAVETAEAVEAIQAINENAPVLLVGMYNMLDGVVVKMNGTEIDLGEYFDYVIKAVDMYNVVYGVTTGNVTIVDVCEASVDEIVFDADELIGLYAEVEELMAGLNGTDLDQFGAILEKIEAIEAKIIEALFTLDSILTNTANNDGLIYIAEQIADSLLVFDHIEEYEYDDEYHWLVCTYCGMVGESGKHEYDNSKDATCNVCDYERVIKKPSSGGSSVGGSFFTNPFSDVNKSDYFYKAVMWAVQQGITAGIGDGQFGPHIDCTRAQVVTMLWRAAGSPRVTAENPFTDVSVNDYYYNAVLWAVKEGITAGTSATTFSPNKTCSRAEIMTFVWKAIGAPAAKGANTFADVAADAYYATAVIWAAENGVTAGTGANTFAPDMICSRAQTVTFLWKVYGV